MTFAQLRALVAVARTGSVTRAAEELGTTQPAVSHALRALERELHQTVFVRRSDRMVLTAIGRAVSHRAAIILDELEGLQQEVAHAEKQADNCIRIGTIPSVNARLLPRILQSFRATYANASLTVIEGSDAEVQEWLLTGAVEIATMTSTAPEFITTPFAHDRLVGILPASHRLSARTAITVADLARYPFIISTGGCAPLIATLAQRARVQLRSHYQVRDTNSILALVADGLGVTIMPELAMPASTTGIRAIPLDPVATRTILLGRRAEDESSLAAALVEIAAQDVDPAHRVHPEATQTSGR